MQAVRSLYETLPYPPPVAEVDAFRDHRETLDGSPRHYFNLFWPQRVPTDDLDILVAGCGTAQAVKLAVQQPAARVTAIDISVASLEHSRTLAARYDLPNLRFHELPIERVGELGGAFDFIMSTGVLHHLEDPDAGLRALRDVLRPDGAMHIMVYATYGRVGVYMLQEYCTRLGIGPDDAQLRDLMQITRDLPESHPLRAFTRVGPDLTTRAGTADALLHPQDRPFTVSQVYDWLERCGLRHMRWFLQAPYLPTCGDPAGSPHAGRLARLSTRDQHCAMELLRGTMITHTFAACREERPVSDHEIDFGGDAWRGYVPQVFAGARVEGEGTVAGGAGILRHPGHRYEDLGLRLSLGDAVLCARINGARTIQEIARGSGLEGDPADMDEYARLLFARLWDHDQVLFRKA